MDADNSERQIPIPSSPPPGDPIARAVFKMFGAPPPPSEEAEIVTGMPGSAGAHASSIRWLRRAI